MAGEFELYKDQAGQYRFRFKVGEKTLLSSGAYKSKYNCTVGIAAARACSPDADRYQSELGGDGKHRFRLVALNNRVLAVSHGEYAAAATGTQIALVRQLAMDARLNDRTPTVRQAEKIGDAELRKNNLRYRIYAALRDHLGAYRPRDPSALIVRGFKNECARNNYWERWIRPVTADRAGARYEYVMCDYPASGRWCFVSERRYSNAKLIRRNV